MNLRHRFLRRYIIGTGTAGDDIFTYFAIGDTELSTELYLGENTTPTVPKIHDSKDVIWVGDQTFSGNTDITSVTISSGVEEIR